MPEEQKPPPNDQSERPEVSEAEEQYIEDDEDDKPIILPKIKQFIAWFWRRRKFSMPITLVGLLFIVFALPTSRYAVLGLVIKRNLPVVIKDNQSGLPVSDAELSYRGQTVVTNGEGQAVFHNVPVGYADIVVKKPYHDEKRQRIALGLSGPNGDYLITIQANGRQVPVQAINKITGENLVGVSITAGDIKATTDQNGEATLVLPLNAGQVEVIVEQTGYNQLKTKVSISQQVVDENTFALVPAGRVYFLSRRSGQLNIMSSNLDGTDSKVVIKATGQEDPNDTTLLATRDWRYLALKARREGENARLYLIDTQTKKLTEIDGANDATIDPIGWSGGHFVYMVNRTKVAYWKANNRALKSFEATSQKITVIDQNASEGDSEYDADYQQFSGVSLVANRVVYGKYWAINSYNSKVKNKKATLYDFEFGQTVPRSLREFALKQDTYGYYSNFLELKQTTPEDVLVRYYNGKDSYYRYNKSSVTDDTSVKEREFQKSYPLFLESPGALNTLWYEERDGKNTLFVGDQHGKNGQVIAAAIPHKPYGWLTDRYILVTKESELYIMPSNGTGGIGEIVKITDYHQQVNYYGHGGYDGL